jgi:hypothetical protein
MTEVLLIGATRSSDIADDIVGADVRVPWSRLRDQIVDVGREMGDLVGALAGSAGLESVAVELGISGTGEVGIIVSKASVTVGSSVTLTFAVPAQPKAIK